MVLHTLYALFGFVIELNYMASVLRDLNSSLCARNVHFRRARSLSALSNTYYIFGHQFCINRLPC